MAQHANNHTKPVSILTLCRIFYLKKKKIDHIMRLIALGAPERAKKGIKTDKMA